jgi:methanogenic corrinoid protein MtbC1
LFLAGHSISQICDDVIAVAFRTIGEKWQCHEVDVHEERRSCQIVLRVLHELRAKQTPPDPEQVAIGATIEGDQYSVPVTMAEIVLRSVGWNARLLGSSIPFESMIKAIKRIEPQLFWLSVSYIPDEDAFAEGFNRLFEAAAKVETAIVVGGRALSSGIRAKLRYTAFCDTMRHLEEFGKTLRRQSKPDPKSTAKKLKNA